MPYADAGHIALIAPYASQAGGVAAAGAEDHPDAQGGVGSNSHARCSCLACLVVATLPHLGTENHLTPTHLGGEPVGRPK